MRKHIFAAIAIVAGLMLVLPTGATAQRVLQSQTETVQEEQNDEEAQIPPLTTARQNRIQQQCEAISQRLSEINTAATELDSIRFRTHGNLLLELKSFVKRVDAAGIDISVLNGDVERFDALLTDANTAWDGYETALAATASADCNTDITSYHEALETARSARTDIQDKVQATREFLSDELNTTLSDIRTQLDGSANENGM